MWITAVHLPQLHHEFYLRLHFPQIVSRSQISHHVWYGHCLYCTYGVHPSSTFWAFWLLASVSHVFSNAFNSINVSADAFFSPLQIFQVELGCLHGNSNQTLYLIHGVECSNFVSLNWVLNYSWYSLLFSSVVIQETPEEDWRTHRPKCCEYNNKDEENSPNTRNDKKYQTSF